MRTLKTALVSLTLCIFGCVSLPTEEQISEADYGSFPDEYINIVKTYYGYHLTHPHSAEYGEITKPKRYWLGNELDSVYYGYLVCAEVNYRNMLGKDTGFIKHALLIHDDIVVKYVEDGDWWGKPLCE